MKKILFTMVNSAAGTLSALIVANLYDKKDEIFTAIYEGITTWREKLDENRFERAKRKIARLKDKYESKIQEEEEIQPDIPEYYANITY